MPTNVIRRQTPWPTPSQSATLRASPASWPRRQPRAPSSPSASQCFFPIPAAGHHRVELGVPTTPRAADTRPSATWTPNSGAVRRAGAKDRAMRPSGPMPGSSGHCLGIRHDIRVAAAWTPVTRPVPRVASLATRWIRRSAPVDPPCDGPGVTNSRLIDIAFQYGRSATGQPWYRSGQTAESARRWTWFCGRQHAGRDKPVPYERLARINPYIGADMPSIQQSTSARPTPCRYARNRTSGSGLTGIPK